ncbi:MAG: 4-hydroxy-tetrahydrodipicolinate reductase [Magnetococcus sp. WYHC-3]
MSHPIGIGILGAAGRMGRMLIQAVVEQPGAQLAAACDRPDAPECGQDAGTLAGVGSLGVPLGRSPRDLFAASDVVIDFTVAAATRDHADLALASATPLVIGTTGVDMATRQHLEHIARSLPLVYAPNYSVGVNLMFKIAAEVARVLNDGYDIEILETHHRHKVDAPSGTALRLGEVIADAVGRNLSEVAVYGREGHTGPRNPHTIGFATMRAGDAVGEHTALFAGLGERLEITHRASSRMTFATGAVRAAMWVAQKPAGLYDMRDILGFR